MKKETTQDLLLSAAVPARIIMKGHIFVLFFLALGLTFFFQFKELLSFMVATALYEIQSGHADLARWMTPTYIGAKLLLAALLFPALFVTFALPSRELYIHGKIPLVTLIKDFSPSIQKTVRSYLRSLKEIVVLLIPIVAAIVLAPSLQEILPDRKYFYTYLTLTGIVGIVTLLKIFPYLIAVVASAVAFYDFRDAVSVSKMIFNYDEVPYLIMATPLLVSTAYLGFLDSSVTRFSSPLLDQGSLRMYGFYLGILLFCYSFLLFTSFVIRKLGEFEAANAAQLNPQPSSIPELP